MESLQADSQKLGGRSSSFSPSAVSRPLPHKDIDTRLDTRGCLFGNCGICKPQTRFLMSINVWGGKSPKLKGQAKQHKTEQLPAE